MNLTGGQEYAEVVTAPTSCTQPQSQPQGAQMFDAFPQSPLGDFKPTFYNPFEVKHRRRTSRYQLKVLERAFSENPKPHAAVRQMLAQKLNMTPRGVQVWFQNRRAKAKKQRALDESQQRDTTESATYPSVETREPTDPSTIDLAYAHRCDEGASNDRSFEVRSAPVACVGVQDDIKGMYVPMESPDDGDTYCGDESTGASCSTSQQPTKGPRPKPNILPIKIPPSLPEQYTLMVRQHQQQQNQQQQHQQQDAQSETVRQWLNADLSAASSGSDACDQFGSVISLSTPQSAVSIPDYFHDYSYSPSVSSVISDKYPTSVISDVSDGFGPSSISLARRSSCPPELMQSFLDMKLANPSEEKQPLTTIMEDETLYNDANAPHFIPGPPQVKRRFSEPVNQYTYANFPQPAFSAQPPTNFVPNMEASSCAVHNATGNHGPADFAFNIQQISAAAPIDQPFDMSNDVPAAPSAPQLIRGYSLDSALWPITKDRTTLACDVGTTLDYKVQKFSTGCQISKFNEEDAVAAVTEFAPWNASISAAEPASSPASSATSPPPPSPPQYSATATIDIGGLGLQLANQLAFMQVYTDQHETPV